MRMRADSSGSNLGSITTEASSKPLVGSVIDALVDHRLEIGAKLAIIARVRTAVDE